MRNEKNVEKLIFPVIQILHGIFECADGMETIASKAQEEPETHLHIFKECCTKFRSYGEELGNNIKTLSSFISKMYSTNIEDEFKKSFIQQLTTLIQDNNIIKTVQKSGEKGLFDLLPISEISHLNLAVHEYEKNYSVLNEIHRLASSIEKLLKETYAQQTNVHLLLWPTNLPKRHEILELYFDARSLESPLAISI